MSEQYSEAIIEQAAKLCHEVNRIYCESHGDTSQPIWDEAPDWQKSSAMAGVRMLANNPDATPEDSHVSWMAQKRIDGWVYGVEKNERLKKHPCMVPYEDLPKQQRYKDALFTTTARSVLLCSQVAICGDS